jgi:hypothetical protein
MSIEEFKNKWGAYIYTGQQANFNVDLLALVDFLQKFQYQRLAIDILSDIPGAELRIKNIDEYQGEIAWGEPGKIDEEGIIVRHSKAVGQQDVDWYFLLKSIASYAIKK